jgi:glycosyltransferase involved in cell wall biosynthesis
MRLLLPLEQRYYRSANGNLYSADPATYSYLRTFLAVFDHVTVVARVRENNRVFTEAQRADGPQVDFALLPDFRSPFECFFRVPQMRKIIQDAAAKTDAVLMRMPGVVSELVRRVVVARGSRYGIHVVGDPEGVFAPAAHSSFLRPFYRSFFTRQLERACRQEANAVAYVSRHTLPQRYPAGEGIPTFVLSNVNLNGAIDAAAAIAARAARIERGSPLHIGTVASLDVPYKGIDVLLQALSICRSRFDFQCTIAGDGVLKQELIELTQKLGLAGRVKFAGYIEPGKMVFEFLDTVDLYVQPSRTEGLPRSLIEAMARGCAAIGSNVGGIPQLLRVSELVAANAPAALAQKIMEVGCDAQRMHTLMQQNVDAAREYEGPKVDATRIAFLTAIRDRSSVFMQGAACACAE